jgi:hypothetical protein
MEFIMLDLFIGSYVDVVTDLSTKTIQGTEESFVETNQPLIFSGYLVDYDEEYLCLGSDPEVIDRVLRRTSALGIEFSDPKDDKDELLEEFDIPTDPNSIN